MLADVWEWTASSPSESRKVVASMTREERAIHRSETIVRFWFSTLDDTTELDRSTDPFRTCFARWYGKERRIDDEIRTLFEPDLIAVTRDGAAWEQELTAWSRAPNGLLALTILLDQFPRNMYRDTPEMYSRDPLALAVATVAIRAYDDAPLPLVQRMFLYMPLMHVENLTLQQAMVRRFEHLVELAEVHSPKNMGFFKYALDYARRHAEVIKAFGRFPHRNAILDRRSTAEETKFLERPDSGF
jgi:uncharacterized protein (DUF924 family)